MILDNCLKGVEMFSGKGSTAFALAMVLQCLHFIRRWGQFPSSTSNHLIFCCQFLFGTVIFKIQNCRIWIGVQRVVSRYEVWKATSQNVTNHTIFGACRQNQFHRLDFWNLGNTFKLAYSHSHPNPSWPTSPCNKSYSGCRQHPKMATQLQNPNN